MTFQNKQLIEFECEEKYGKVNKRKEYLGFLNAKKQTKKQWFPKRTQKRGMTHYAEMRNSKFIWHISLIYIV